MHVYFTPSSLGFFICKKTYIAYLQVYATPAMQGRAKGLKVQVERTANHLSNQDTSAFIPPTEGTDSDQVTAAAAADKVGESGQSSIVQASSSLC